MTDSFNNINNGFNSSGLLQADNLLPNRPIKPDGTGVLQTTNFVFSDVDDLQTKITLLDSHIADDTVHGIIDDNGTTSTTKLWSSSKVDSVTNTIAIATDRAHRFKGHWNPSTNIPSLLFNVNGHTEGDWYTVNTDGLSALFGRWFHTGDHLFVGLSSDPTPVKQWFFINNQSINDSVSNTHQTLSSNEINTFLQTKTGIKSAGSDPDVATTPFTRRGDLFVNSSSKNVFICDSLDLSSWKKLLVINDSGTDLGEVWSAWKSNSVITSHLSSIIDHPTLVMDDISLNNEQFVIYNTARDNAIVSVNETDNKISCFSDSFIIDSTQAGVGGANLLADATTIEGSLTVSVDQKTITMPSTTGQRGVKFDTAFTEADTLEVVIKVNSYNGAQFWIGIMDATESITGVNTFSRIYVYNAEVGASNVELFVGGDTSGTQSTLPSQGACIKIVMTGGNISFYQDNSGTNSSYTLLEYTPADGGSYPVTAGSYKFHIADRSAIVSDAVFTIISATIGGGGGATTNADTALNITGGATVSQNLTVQGAFTTNDMLIKIAEGHKTDTLDDKNIGIVGEFKTGGGTQCYAGLIRNHTDKEWYLTNNYVISGVTDLDTHDMNTGGSSQLGNLNMYSGLTCDGVVQDTGKCAWATISNNVPTTSTFDIKGTAIGGTSGTYYKIPMNTSHQSLGMTANASGGITILTSGAYKITYTVSASSNFGTIAYRFGLFVGSVGSGNEINYSTMYQNGLVDVVFTTSNTIIWNGTATQEIYLGFVPNGNYSLQIGNATMTVERMLVSA